MTHKWQETPALPDAPLLDDHMAYKVAAFYQFAPLPDFRELREPLRALCGDLALKGSVLLAHEGINGTLAGGEAAIDRFVAALRHGDLFAGRLDRLELKYSSASEMPFGRLKIRLKKEIVTFGDRSADPTRQVGIYVEPKDWNDLIAAPDTVSSSRRSRPGSFICVVISAPLAVERPFPVLASYRVCWSLPS